ncbi:hypothetical protein HCN44_002916 [Aphidius gifuensis]|uniref:Membrane insertase YidC/Oxa/ALB C-terminal domain-containing protein n=2 Tax=Aphidius gifuensis TaxID=684658 RepID=A0A835CQ43_APHGI|nr:mitochondrial inner membrane protein OXA1L isoform X1 [Aphidius gifuensis]KAF7991354.1 hypothetical protein HCN44_002916 [Aphidius gifuensis]
MLSRSAICMNHRILSKKLVSSQDIMTYRSIHMTYRITSGLKNKNILNKLSRYSPLLSSSFVRSISDNSSNNVETQTALPSSPSSGIDQAIQETQESTATSAIINNITPESVPTNLFDKIPDAPLPPVVEAIDIIKDAGEASFASIGLGGWSPVGIVQQLLEFVHIGWGIPWWGTIALGTICVRSLMFPLVILAQRNAAKMHNSLPGMQKIQEKITEARNCGDNMEAARATQELMWYMSSHGCNPMKNLIVPICQAPVFISFFFALKGMANLPVDSMRHGGLWWFTDLTIPDPYYILPVVTAASLGLILKIGVDGPKLESMGALRYIIQALPFIILPFTVNFPGAIVWYWTSTNLFSMAQVGILRIPKVRNFFKIAAQVEHPPSVLKPKKNMKQGLQESWTNMRLARELADRQSLDRMQFHKAGRGPIEKTYSYNPTELHKNKKE